MEMQWLTSNSRFASAIYSQSQEAAFVGGSLLYKRGDREGHASQLAQGITDEIADMKDELKKLATVITTLAVQNERLDNQASRLNTIDSKLEALRRGDGFVAGARGVEREF